MADKKIFDNAEKKKDFLISVIVPVYNAEKYLVTCLESLINQTYENLQIICVDDGSRDHSLEILEFYKNKDKRIQVYTQKNSGPSVARNKGLDFATGDYISFVDSDDYLQLNAYENLSEVAEQGEWDLIIFGSHIIGQGNDYLLDKVSTSFKIYNNCKEVVFREKAARPFLWLHFIKRELLEKPTILRFDESFKLGEDQILQFAYVPRAKNVIVIEDRLYNYRITQNASLMQLYNNRRITKTDLHFQIVEKVIEEFKSLDYYYTMKNHLWTWVINFIYYTICDFPAEIKKTYAQRLFSLMERYSCEEYLISENEQQLLRHLKEWSNDEMSDVDRLHDLVNRTKREKYEIDETLKSRAFKLGKILTPKKKRMNRKDILE